MFFDRGNHYEFLSLGQELAAPGELQHPQTFDFNFKNVEKQYESYSGINVRLRYFVQVTVSRRMADVIREKDIWVYSYRIPPEMNSSIKMDVGIEDCLHIEFEYSKSKYHLKDVIVGRIYFLLVRLKIKHMELSIIRRETTGAAPNQYNESETLVRFEVSHVPQASGRELTCSRLWMDPHQEERPFLSDSSLEDLTLHPHFEKSTRNTPLDTTSVLCLLTKVSSFVATILLRN